jgi:hypothetical protein
MNHTVTYCWSCGRSLLVSSDRLCRQRDEAGENTVDPDKRVCVECWKEIGRVRTMPSLAILYR